MAREYQTTVKLSHPKGDVEIIIRSASPDLASHCAGTVRKAFGQKEVKATIEEILAKCFPGSPERH